MQHHDLKAFDAQAAMGFVRSQTAHIEPTVYRTQYASIQYPDLIPVDYSAHPFAQSVVYTSLDSAGQAKWLNGNAGDIPRVDMNMSEFKTSVHAAAVGYGWGWEEINQAQMLGIPLSPEKALTARRVAEEFIDTIALEGDANKGFNGGLINHPNVAATAAITGAWSPSVDGDLILGDLNQALQIVNTATNTIVYADTLLLPYSKFHFLASTRLGDTATTLLDFFRANNITAARGGSLLIRSVRGLETAGVSGGNRMVAYRRSPEVLKLHIPMPHRFLPVFQKDALNWEVPGIMRLGGLDVKLPKEMSYVDGI